AANRPHAAPMPDESPAHARLKEVLPALQRDAGHEVAMRQADGDLEPGDGDPADLVDDVLADLPVHVDPAEPGTGAPGRRQARRDARLEDVVRDAEVRAEADTPYEQSLPISPPNFAVSDLGRQVLDFWVIDEELMLDDVFPDPNPVDPEDLLA